MIKKRRALVIEDEESTRVLCELLLQKQAIEVFTARNIVSARALLEQHQKFDLILLDLSLPDGDGIELATELKEAGPILMMSIRASAEDRIQGFYSGASDYLSKPFHPDELLFRIHKLLNQSSASSHFQLGKWLLNIHIPEIIDIENNQTNPLTVGELTILRTLIEAEQQPVPRATLKRAISGNSQEGSAKSIDVMVSRLRKKIEADPTHPHHLITVKQVGYRIANLQPYQSP